MITPTTPATPTTKLMMYEDAKDISEQAAKFLFMIASSSTFMLISEDRLAKTYHLIGTLALAAGIPEDHVRAMMKDSCEDLAEDWKPKVT